MYGIIFIIATPFTSSASRFETYKLHSIPINNPHIKNWIAWMLEYTHLLVSSDRQYYLLLNALNFTTCEEMIYF